MYQVRPEIWNQVAATGKVKQEYLRELMSLPADEMWPALDEQRVRLEEKSGLPPTVAAAYQLVAPLLAAHEAISEFVRTTDSFEARLGLPEVLSAAEAVEMANMEHQFMTPAEREQLLALLLPLQD